MAPVIAAAGISGLANLVGGLMSMKAQEKERKRQMLMEGLKANTETQLQATQGHQQGQQNAFQQLMQSYQGILR